MTDEELQALTDDELVELYNNVNREIQRRNTLVKTQAEVARLNADYLEAEGTTPGEAWRQPTGAHDAYPKDWIVSHVGGQWVSLVDANVWEPGVANWRADSGEEFPDWVQPTGAPDAYSAGAKVSHVGKHWTSDVEANVWEPGVYGWTEVI